MEDVALWHPPPFAERICRSLFIYPIVYGSVLMKIPSTSLLRDRSTPPFFADFFCLLSGACLLFLLPSPFFARSCVSSFSSACEKDKKQTEGTSSTVFSLFSCCPFHFAHSHVGMYSIEFSKYRILELRIVSRWARV